MTEDLEAVRQRQLAEMEEARQRAEADRVAAEESARRLAEALQQGGGR
ncbi:hypothetical protein [Streptomyces sp. AJS327]|nr:hypothetical protein [Streptomyces sp. AJS327]